MTDIKPGDCFFNVARFSCLRVIHNHGEWCDALTWRPNGTRGSNRVKVHTKNLLLTPYWRMEATRVYAGGQSFEFEVGEKRELHNGTTYCTSISSTDWSTEA